jgi:hypothetical protein
MLVKYLGLGASSLVALMLTAMTPPQGPGGGFPPAPKEKKKKGQEGGELRKPYELLRKLRADARNVGRPEERLRDWTERATKFYRDAIRAQQAGDFGTSRIYGAAAHDLARAVDHSRNASLYDVPDNELPAPPDGLGRDDDDERTRRDLYRAFERIRYGLDGLPAGESKFYLDAAKDLYNAARRDAEAGRIERAGELARAAEAMSHVPDHLANLTPGGRRAEGPGAFEPRPEPKEKKEKKAEKGDRPGPLPKSEPPRFAPAGGDRLPPPLS